MPTGTRTGRGTRNIEASGLWIVPNNFRACRSAQDTAASSLDLNEQAFACGQSLMWRGKHSQQQTWLQRLKREKWLRLLCGRMLRPSLSQTFTAEWASCLPVIPASRSARPAKEKAQQTSATCGHTFKGQLQLFDLDSASLRMSKDILPAALRTSATTWVNWVTSLRQDYSARLNAGPAIKENGYSSLQKGWATPRTTDWNGASRERVSGQSMEFAQLREQVLQTGQPVQGNPSTDGKNQGRAESLKLNRKLNPNWVEQLMGLDPGRTQLPTEWIG